MTDSGIEICANSFASALAAQAGGAVRVELCDNMAEGGTTPSYAQIKLCKERLNIAVWPIIRPRGGDFIYSDAEFELMKEDLKMCRELGCDGAVTGILLANGEVDRQRCEELIRIAHPMPLAFHRAFDMCRDLYKSMEEIIDMGFVRILSSGSYNSAEKGIDVLSGLIKQAGKRISIMPGSGINPQNLFFIREKTGAETFHSSARVEVSSKMIFRNQNAKMGNVQDEYIHEETSIQLVQQMVNLLK